MPLTLPFIDDRRYDELVGEALARIPVHTPEWTNFNRSDPGVTLIEVFAFLTESLLYRANQIPERNRKKFLQLLRVPLHSSTPSRSMIAFSAAPAADPKPLLITEGFEVRAGQVPFRTTRTVDVLPVEGRMFVKKKITDPPADVVKLYEQLYASYRGDAPSVVPELYEAVPFPSRDGAPLALSDTADNSVWLALLALDANVDLALVRKAIASRTLTIGVVPSLSASEATLAPGRRFGATSTLALQVWRPDAANGLPDDPEQRTPTYRLIDARANADVFSVAGTIDITLPSSDQLKLWENLDPLEAGVNGLPPAIEDAAVADRIVTWLRLTPSAPTSASFQWMGIHASPVTQSARILGELLPNGNGEPDQIARLALPPVLPGSVTITVDNEAWFEVDDLAVAPPEVPQSAASKVFTVNAESGEVRFGDGLRGARPAEGSTLRASYEYALGVEGNVGAGAINASPALPAGIKVSNPIAAWGGAESETVAEGEKQISRYLQHRERLVTASDFVALTLRTPGVDIARVEVLANYHPERGTEAPGVVTLMLVPAYDPEQPEAPLPRRPFIDAVCRHLDPRRLITTELLLRGPDYQGIWISIGIKVEAGFNESDVCEAVKHDVLAFLAPFQSSRQPMPDAEPVVLGGTPSTNNGWKLGKAVVALELLAVANRTRGVEFARDDIALARADGSTFARIDMTGLQLPRILGIRVTNGPAAPLGDLMGGAGGTGNGNPNGGGAPTKTPRVVQVPVIPTECRC
ncbi:MAG TPA: baseplate J/gp47 family protein [Thermoanaerobaculia bacterium]